MINKCHGFKKPKKKPFTAAFVMFLCLAMMLASTNIAYARKSNTWPYGVGNQQPPKNAMPYFWGEAITKELNPDDVMVNISNLANINDRIKNAQNWYENKGDLYYSCFGKFQLHSANPYGTVGYATEGSYGYNQMPYIPASNSRTGVGGRAYHFFDYPGDTSGGGDDDFSFNFQVKLDKTLWEASQKKGNLLANLVIESLDTSGDHAHAELFCYKSAPNNYDITEGGYNQLAYLNHTENAKWITWSSGWKELPANTKMLGVQIYSTNGGGSDANDAELQNPRVLILDNSEPTIASVGIIPTTIRLSYNFAYNSSSYVVKAGEDIMYIVTFDEPVKCTDISKPTLEIESSGKNLEAKLVSTEKVGEYKKQFTFIYRLKEGDGIVPSGRAVRINNANCFEDVGKNKLAKDDKPYADIKPSLYRNGSGKTLLIICDSESPTIHADGLTSDGSGFYARKMDENTWRDAKYVRSMEANNAIPSELKKGTSAIGDEAYTQKKIFSVNSQDKPIFRIFLKDMIDNNDQNGILRLSNQNNPLKLKLNIFDSNKNIISGRNAYAELIAYRYVGQNDIDAALGTNTGWTELYFAYTPKASDFQGLEPDVYSVDIAATVSDGNFIFDENVFDRELKDFAGNTMARLTFPVIKINAAAKAPANNIVKIDMAPPVLKSVKLSDGDKPVNKLNGTLIFEEISEQAYPFAEAKIRVVKKSNGTGNYQPVRIKLQGQSNPTNAGSSENGGVSEASMYLTKIKGTDSQFEMKISNLTIDDPNASISDKYYLEYEITDLAGNVATNKGNGIELNIDILPPAPVIGSDGKWYDVNRSDEGAADVTFNLEDVSGLADSFSYALDYDNRTSFPYGNSNAGLPKSNSKDSVTIETNKDTRESVTVWTQFSDSIGNTMKDYIKTDPINFDTRTIDAEFYCDSYGTLQKTYDFRVKINKNPFSGTGNSTQEGTLKIKYKWLPVNMDINSDAAKKIDYAELSFTSASKEVKDGMEVSLAPAGFQQEWLQKLNMKGSAFQGYYRCYARVEFWATLDGNTEELVYELDLSYRERYFDNTPPTVAFRPFSKTYSQKPVIAFDITDDGSSASTGNNINMDKEYTYYTYVVKRTDASGKDYYVDVLSDKNPIYTTTYSITEPNLGWKKTADGKTVGVDDTEVYAKVMVQDKAGNTAEGIIGGPILIDVDAPIANETTANIKEGAESLTYQNEIGNYTVVRDLTDITGVTLNITDNTSSNVTVAGEGGSKATLKCAEDQAGVFSGTLSLNREDFIFIESTMGGVEHYCAKLAISDEAGNTSYSYFNVIVDNSAVYSNTPYTSLSSNNDEYTTENVVARQYININDYETADILMEGLSLTDPSGKVVGEPVIVIGDKAETEPGSESSKNYIELTLKENTTGNLDQPSDVYITITDKFGNKSGKIFFIARGIDKTSPTITVTPSSGNNLHEGVFSIYSSDNEYLIGVDAALMKNGAKPEEDDYFSSVWPLSTLMTEGAGKSGEIDESEKGIGYAPSYANLEIISSGISDLTGSFNYRCLPAGNYTLYIRATDGAGNKTVSTYSFTADNKAPEVQNVSYSPSPDRKTGGTVSVKIKTDQPVTIQKEAHSAENPYTYMQYVIEDFMLNGFTYRFNGEMKNLSLLDLELRRFHYWSIDAWELKSQAGEEAEEEIILPIVGPKENYDNEDDYNNAYNIAFDDNFDKIMALTRLKYMDKLREADRDEATGISIADEDYYLFGDFAADDESPPVEAEELKKMKDLLRELGVYILCGEEEDEEIPLQPYYNWEILYSELGPEEKESIILQNIEAIKNRVNGYYTDESRTEINESIFTLQVSGAVFNKDPENYAKYATVNILKYPEAIDAYIPKTIVPSPIPEAPPEETIPLSPNSSDEFKDLWGLYQPDVAQIQELRKNAITQLAAKFADMGIAAVDQSFNTENVVTYRNNVREMLYAVNKFGQATEFEVRIDNIDQANAPSLSPNSVALVYRNGEEADNVTAVNKQTVMSEDAHMVRFVADVGCNILNTGENANLYFFDFRFDGEPITVSESVYANLTVIDSVYNNPFFGLNEHAIRSDFEDLDNITFYKTYEIDLKGKNGLITFKYMDPSFAGQDDKTYWSESSYYVNVFDQEPPAGIIQYSMDPNSPTNMDIVASVVNVQDNRTDSSMIKIYLEDDPYKNQRTSYTFHSNGSKTFVLEDYAGNKAYLTATVTGIDTDAPSIEGKFIIDGKEYPAVWDDTDWVYKYTGPYTNGTITAQIIDSDTGEVYSNYVFDDNETVPFTVFDPAGNESTIELAVDRFDFTPPVPDPSSIRYYVGDTEFLGTSTNKNVKVRFTVTDNITPDASYTTPWINVSGLNMKVAKVITADGIAGTQEVQFTDTGLVKPTENPNEFEIEFEYNGKADIYFTDGAGNQAMITVTMDMIDKIPPSVKSEVRTSAKGVPVNEPVTVAVYPDEICDGWITDDKGNKLVENRGLSTAALTYTFDKENDGDSNMVWFHFADASGNEMVYQVTAYDIDLTKPVLTYELVAVNKGVPYDKVLPVDENEAMNQLIPYNGAATYKITVDPASVKTKTGTERDQFTGGVMAGDTIELVNRPNVMYHTFMANGNYIFYYRDLAGNMNSLTLTVDCIDDNNPDADVSFAPDKSAGYTKEDVVITIKPYDIDAEGNRTNDAHVYWNREKYSKSGDNTFTYTVTENGEYEFVVVDDSGNSNTVKAVVDWIDKEAPVISVEGYADIYVLAEDGNGNDEPVIDTIRKNISKLTITDNIDGSIAFDDSRVTVNYYLSDGVTPVNINAVDFSMAGEYLAIIKVRDNVGNESQLPRRIIVVGSDDVLPLINNQIIMPSEIAYFYTGDLSLNVLNLEKAGGTVYYSFVKGEYHPAELKGYNKEPITTQTSDIKLQTSGSGIYTLVLTTQERKTVVVYIFVASNQ